MNIDNFDVPVGMWTYARFEGTKVYLKSVKSLHFREYCSAYELLLKTIYNIRRANSAMNLYINNANVNG